MSIASKLDPKRNKWQPCLAAHSTGLAFFDGIQIETDRLADSRGDRVLPIIEGEQVLLCRMIQREFATTRVKGARCFDLGTGSGVFAIYAATLGCNVTAIDISDRALQFAQYNERLNSAAIKQAKGTIRFIKRCYKQQPYEDILEKGPFDYVFLNPPFNPTLEGFQPVLCASAGPDGQQEFKEQLPIAALLLRPGGKCLGVHLALTDAHGNLHADIKSKIDEHFCGGTFRYALTISKPIKKKDFIRKQYAAYLSHQIIKEHIEGVEDTAYFSFIYYEITKAKRNVMGATTKVFQESPDHENYPTVFPAVSWDDRISLHRQVIANPGFLSASPPLSAFPSFGLFLTDSSPTIIDISQREDKRNSVLRDIDNWLASNRIMDKREGVFSSIMIDSVPWYLPNNPLQLRSETSIWSQESHTCLDRFLHSLVKEIKRLHEKSMATFLHPGTKQLSSSGWRETLYTYFCNNSHETNGTGFQKTREECIHEQLVDEYLSLVNQSQNMPPIDFRIEHPTSNCISIDMATTSVTLRDFNVPESISQNVKAVEQRTAKIKTLLGDRVSDNPIKQDADMTLFDLNICHHVVHRKFDQLAKESALAKQRFSSYLISIPISMRWDYQAKTDEYNSKGYVYIYAISLSEWNPRSERIIFDLVRLLSILYGDEFSDKASKAIREFFSGDVFDLLSHELSKQTSVLFSNRLRKISTIFQVNNEPRSNDTNDPDDWPEPLGTLEVPAEYATSIANWLICPMPRNFDSLRDYLVLWAGSRSFVRIAPNAKTLKDLVNRAIDIAGNARIAELSEIKGAKPRSIKEIESQENVVLKQKLTQVEVETDQNAYDAKLNLQDSNEVVAIITRCLAAALSNAFQHANELSGSIKINLTLQKSQSAKVGSDVKEGAGRNDDQSQKAGVWFELKNPRDPNRPPETGSYGGSKQVIESCLKMLKSEKTYFEDYTTEPKTWHIRFLLPVCINFRNSDIHWLSSELG